MRNDQGTPGIARRVRQTGGVKRYRVVSRGPGQGQVKYPTGNNDDDMRGVTLDDAADGRGVTLQTDHQAEIEAAGSFPANADLVVGTDGRVSNGEAVTAAHCHGGKAEQASTGAGDVVMVDIAGLGRRIPASA